MECASCVDLLSRLERLEKRLDRAEEEAAHWKKRWALVDEENRQLRGRVSLLERENAELKKTIEKKDAQIAHLQKLLFAEKSEASSVTEDETPLVLAEAISKRPRGKQPGTKGFGRKIRTTLPVEVREHDVPEGEQRCPKCGCERSLSPFAEESEEITYRVQLVRIRHRRLKRKKQCACPGVPEFITAPAPPKLIQKGLFDSEFWNHVLIEKFLLQRPLAKVCTSLSFHGLKVSAGTLTSGIKHLTKLFAPLYNSLRSRIRQENRWQMDETHWRVYVDEMGKENHKWWLWVAVTKTATVFTLDPTRSADVPRRLLKDIPVGILSCDRYSAYKALDDGIARAYCWAHVRRDFIHLRDGYPKIAPIAQSWVERINDLFRTNRLRLSASGKDRDYLHTQLSALLDDMQQYCIQSLQNKDLPDKAVTTLESLQRHWTGLTLFLEFPEIPMDNNASERALRTPVVGRKNYYGSRSIWSGHQAAMLFSIFATVQKHGLDPRKYLGDYLLACARNRGRPPTDISPFTPWTISQPTPSLPAHPTVH